MDTVVLDSTGTERRRPKDPQSGEEGARESSSHATSSSVHRRLRRGIEGGALATAVMTVYRLPVTRSLPPTAEFIAKYVTEDDPDDHPVAALILHLAYGVGAGAAFAGIFSSRKAVGVEAEGHGPPSPRGEITLSVFGLLYGLALSAFGERIVLDAFLDVDPDDRFAFHVSHVLYGITLGAWIGTRTRET